MTEARAWTTALLSLAVAWLLDRVADLIAKLRVRYWRRRLHRSIVDAYATRRDCGSNPRFDAAIRAGEDELLNFQPTNRTENLTQ